MKLLIRPQEPPHVLVNFNHGQDSFSTCSRDPECSASIWGKLDLMQSEFCAYCECVLRSGNKHIEHFIPQKKDPTLTFSWENLFGSCSNKNRCGVHKDADKTDDYEPLSLLKPDCFEASRYLIFLTSGRVRPRCNLSDSDKLRAIETCKVFNLDLDTSLVNARRNAIRLEMGHIKALYALLDGTDYDEWKSLYDEQIISLEGREYRTALEHAWKDNTQY